MTTLHDREGAVLPLGGLEATGGYKGYGLGLMVEVLCGVAAAGTWGPHIRSWGSTAEPGGLSHCFLALDPSLSGPGFPGRLQELLQEFRATEPAEPGLPVLVPGDPERARQTKVALEGGVRYTKPQFERFLQFSDQFGVSPPEATEV